MSFDQINIMQRLLDTMLKEEQEETKRQYRNVMRELTEKVDPFDAPSSFNQFVQEECSMMNTERRCQIEREFWQMSLDHKQWRVVEKAEPHYKFFYSGDGIACRDASKMQLIAV